jgi:hypothetical protein
MRCFATVSAWLLLCGLVTAQTDFRSAIQPGVPGLSPDLYGDVFNVRAFGATGNGSTDDTFAIEKIISALTNRGVESSISRMEPTIRVHVISPSQSRPLLRGSDSWLSIRVSGARWSNAGVLQQISST